jgi:hypothetical protein
MDHARCSELVAVSGRRRSGDVAAWLLCVEHVAIVQALPVCGAPTRFGRPCRTPVRVDLGHAGCFNHSGVRTGTKQQTVRLHAD